jgi:starvation-inducible outer membrane lipoprotein
LRDPISKITRAKWTGGVAQEVELLFCKCEALSSNPSPIKKEKKQNNNQNQPKSKQTNYAKVKEARFKGHILYDSFTQNI